MLWLIVVAATVLSGFLLYSKRFTSQLRIFKLQLVQWYYLLLAGPIVYVAMINLGIEVFQRPPVPNTSFPSIFLLSTYIFFCSISMLGVAIHSTATSLSQSFPKKAYTKAYFINETFHGPLSHDMAFLGAIFAVTALSVLELSHPSNDFANQVLASISGLIIGTLFALSVIRSTHIGVSLAASFLGLVILAFSLQSVLDEFDHLPVVTTTLVGVATIFLFLALTALIIFFSRSLTKRLIKILFPRGHPIHESFHIY